VWHKFRTQYVVSQPGTTRDIHISALHIICLYELYNWNGRESMRYLKMEAAWASETLPTQNYPSLTTQISAWKWRQHGPLKRWHLNKTYTASQLMRPHSEDGGSMDLWNIGILTKRYMASQLLRPPSEGGGSMGLWNVGITTTQHYTASQHRRPPFSCVKYRLSLVICQLSKRNISDLRFESSRPGSFVS